MNPLRIASHLPRVFAAPALRPAIPPKFSFIRSFSAAPAVPAGPKPFRVLGLQQIAIGGPSKAALSSLWVDLFGCTKTNTFKSERENVDEDILTLGKGPYAVEVDLMQPINPEKVSPASLCSTSLPLFTCYYESCGTEPEGGHSSTQPPRTLDRRLGSCCEVADRRWCAIHSWWHSKGCSWLQCDVHSPEGKSCAYHPNGVVAVCSDPCLCREMKLHHNAARVS